MLCWGLRKSVLEESDAAQRTFAQGSRGSLCHLIVVLNSGTDERVNPAKWAVNISP